MLLKRRTTDKEVVFFLNNCLSLCNKRIDQFNFCVLNSFSLSMKNMDVMLIERNPKSAYHSFFPLKVLKAKSKNYPKIVPFKGNFTRFESLRKVVFDLIRAQKNPQMFFN